MKWSIRGAQASWISAFTPLAAVAVLAMASSASEAGDYKVVDVKYGGTIAGVIKFENDYPSRETVKVDRDPATCGTRHVLEEFVVDPETKGLKNVVTILLGVDSGKGFSESWKLEINQEGCRYLPHVQVGFMTPKAKITQESQSGIALHIVNSDDVFHNVHMFGMNEETMFNIPSLPGDSSVKLLPESGIYEIKCDMHTWMSAWVLVLDHPYVAISGADGTFKIENVPPGEYKLSMWHEGLGSVERDVVVKANQETSVDFVIGEEE